jgi:hypothetical protein
MSRTNEISEVTRRALADYFEMSGSSWAGRLNDQEFAARLYDLSALPSQDGRYRDAAADIYQHAVRNSDWGPAWIFYDRRFNLIRAPDEDLLRFLCETVHPIVRAEPQEAYALVEAYNRLLAPDGWRLTKAGEISGHPLFAATSAARVELFEEPTGWPKVDRQLQEMRLRLAQAQSEEQCQAVGLLAREVLITAAQTVFDPDRHPAIDRVEPSNTDARRLLEAIFAIELEGGHNEEARAHAKAAVRLSLALQHKRTADFRTAALCAEGAASVVNMLAIISGRRDGR